MNRLVVIVFITFPFVLLFPVQYTHGPWPGTSGAVRLVERFVFSKSVFVAGGRLVAGIEFVISGAGAFGAVLSAFLLHPAAATSTKAHDSSPIK